MFLLTGHWSPILRLNISSFCCLKFHAEVWGRWAHYEQFNHHMDLEMLKIHERLDWLDGLLIGWLVDRFDSLLVGWYFNWLDWLFDWGRLCRCLHDYFAMLPFRSKSSLHVFLQSWTTALAFFKLDNRGRNDKLQFWWLFIHDLKWKEQS